MSEYAPIGGETTIEAAGSISSYQPRVAGLTGGGYVVTWTMEEPDDSGVYARVFSADGVPVSERLSVNSHRSGSQNTPDITALDGGGFVITWTDNNGINGDPDESLSAIRGQLYSANGTRIGGEFLINTTTDLAQFQPSVDALDGGGFVVSWTDSSAGFLQSDWTVRAQQFSNAGMRTGPEVVVPERFGNQLASDVAGLNGGGFVAVWVDRGGRPEDTSGSAVFARIFDADGLPVTGEFLVNNSTMGDQADAQVALLHNGNFVITWSDASGQVGDAEPLSIKAQIFSGTGVRIGTEILVNTTTVASQTDPVITALPNGAFAISWQDFSIDDPTMFNDTSLIRVQVFDGSGAKQGDELQVNTTMGLQRDPTITMLTNGDFVVAWGDPTGDEGALYIRAQAFRLQPSDPGTDDTLTGTGDADALNGRAGNDVLLGLAGNDQLFGGDGDDMLKGGAGDDLLSGGPGTDTADYADLRGVGVTVSLAIARYGAQDTGGAGIDALESIENLRGSREGDVLSGDAGANRIKGETGDDVLFGDAGADLLFGDGGNDVLDGGEGYDVLAGGHGMDRFVFSTLDGDLVKDWQSGEKIDFTGFFQTSVHLETRYGRTFAGFDNDADGEFDFGFIEILATGLSQSDFLL